MGNAQTMYTMAHQLLHTVRNFRKTRVQLGMLTSLSSSLRPTYTNRGILSDRGRA
jgi:hypothetical protein